MGRGLAEGAGPAAWCVLGRAPGRQGPSALSELRHRARAGLEASGPFLGAGGAGGPWNQLPCDPPRGCPPSRSGVRRPPSPAGEDDARNGLRGGREAGPAPRTPRGSPDGGWRCGRGRAPRALRSPRLRRRARHASHAPAAAAAPSPAPRAPRPAPAPLGAARAPPSPEVAAASPEPPEPPEPPELPGRGAGAASGPAFETTSAAAAAARGRNARLGQLRPGPGLASAPAAEPAARVLLQPTLRLAAFPGRPVLEPWGPPSPCLPRCPRRRPADLGCRGSPPHAPSPASAPRDPG
nr:vegetative cell wall protein gp1-like [Saimiri boliviensis boliviensis]